MAATFTAGLAALGAWGIGLVSATSELVGAFLHLFRGAELCR